MKVRDDLLSDMCGFNWVVVLIIECWVSYSLWKFSVSLFRYNFIIWVVDDKCFYDRIIIKLYSLIDMEVKRVKNVKI